jgi:hypothetical protein
MKNITGAVNASQAFSGTGNAAGVLCYFAGSVPTVVQAPSSVGSGGLPTLSIPFLSNTVAGNAAIVWVHSPLISPSGGGPNPPQPMACTDSQGNVGILIGSAFSPSSPTSGTGMQVSVFLIPNLKGAAETITVIVPGFPANTQVGTMQIYEITPPPPLAARPRFRPVTVLDLLTGTTGSGLIALSSSPTISNPLIAGTITSYNGTATVGAGIPSIVAQVNNTTASANIGTTTLFSPQAAGLYRVSYSVIVKTVGGTSTLPNLTFVWTDADNATSQSASFAAGTPTANTLTTLFTGTQIMSVRSGTLIQYKTGDVTAYASTGAAMVYSVRIRLEAL